MKDFSKWADMWDAYTSSGDAVPGSPASICLIIGMLLLVASGDRVWLYDNNGKPMKVNEK